MPERQVLGSTDSGSDALIEIVHCEDPDISDEDMSDLGHGKPVGTAITGDPALIYTGRNNGLYDTHAYPEEAPDPLPEAHSFADGQAVRVTYGGGTGLVEVNFVDNGIDVRIVGEEGRFYYRPDNFRAYRNGFRLSPRPDMGGGGDDRRDAGNLLPGQQVHWALEHRDDDGYQTDVEQVTYSPDLVVLTDYSGNLLAQWSSDAPSQVSSVPVAQGCPTSPAQSNARPQWTMKGTSGGLAMVAATDREAPSITVEQPLSVATTVVKTLVEGSGQAVDAADTVMVCYLGVNGRDGARFDSSYENGQPVSFPLDGVIVGFSKAIVGQRVGSKVGVVVASSDGYPDGQPSAGIGKGDTLIFEISILGVE